jgi:Flp pilus assembly pilin Flp
MFTEITERLMEVLRARITNVAIDRKTAANRHGLGRNTRAQTMVEYALLVGFVAVVGGATLATAPTTADGVKTIVNKVIALLALAAASTAQSC